MGLLPKYPKLVMNNTSESLELLVKHGYTWSSGASLHSIQVKSKFLFLRVNPRTVTHDSAIRDDTPTIKEILNGL